MHVIIADDLIGQSISSYDRVDRYLPNIPVLQPLFGYNTNN